MSRLNTVPVAPLVAAVEERADVKATNPAAGNSLRSNFAWTLTGNIGYAACQWGMLVLLAKMGSTEMVGQFALALAILTPILGFTNLQLRSVQATDARRDF